MAHIINQSAIGEGAKLWLQAYDEDNYEMVLRPVCVDTVEEEVLFFHSSHGGDYCGWREDYNYRFGWRCWDTEPDLHEMAREPFAS